MTVIAERRSAENLRSLPCSKGAGPSPMIGVQRRDSRSSDRSRHQRKEVYNGRTGTQEVSGRDQHCGSPRGHQPVSRRLRYDRQGLVKRRQRSQRRPSSCPCQEQLKRLQIVRSHYPTHHAPRDYQHTTRASSGKLFLCRTSSQVWTGNHTWDRILRASPVSLS